MKTSLTPMKKIENSINKIQEKKNLRQQDKSEFTKKHIKEEDGDGCQR
jgi:hypothetical protein